MNRAIKCKYLFLLSIFWSAAALPQVPDYAREKRWAAEITPAILVGEPVYLAPKSGPPFLAIYTPRLPNATQARARAAVIVVHGMGVHPDWNLINTLRSQLPEQGYATLSLQMPVLAAEAKGESYPLLFPQAAERLHAAVAYLRAQAPLKIAIVSHSMGARMVNYYLAHGGAAEIDAWAAVGISSGVYLQAETFKAPVLDIYGEKDFPVVLAHAAQRATAIQRIRGSGQVSVAGADHYFNGAEAELTRQVKLFLDKATR